MGFPVKLSYTLPTGEEYSVVITNEGQSEDEYDKMFSACGHDVPYSVDDVEHEAHVITRYDDQLPFKHGQPWSRGDVPVGDGASQFDDLDAELTDEEIEECMVDDPFFPIELDTQNV